MYSVCFGVSALCASVVFSIRVYPCSSVANNPANRASRPLI